ncbi:helix-turn-helix domain-containing protein [Desulfotomaculum sp. 1211_IL3151]|uniref:helix-turn-helix domain-containing protein n=1 Tax=Desulfotomaculum sp. 1211_IL3151 TaxID=3084055 RepID=UPI002FD96D56
MGTFRNRMRELRESHNLTQQTLAEALNVGKSAIALYETEKRQPDPDTLKKLAQFFGCSIDYLLGLSDDYQGNTPLHSTTPTLPEDMLSFVSDRNNHKLIKIIQTIKTQGYSNEVIEEWLLSLSTTLNLIKSSYQTDKMLVQETKEKYKKKSTSS